MTRSMQRYQKAIKMLLAEYRKAQAQVSIGKPLAYALYQVWKYFDKHEKSRLPQESEKYCDRNICISNEYNGIGCNECEVTKSREPQEK